MASNNKSSPSTSKDVKGKKKIISVKYEKNDESIIIPISVVITAILISITIFAIFIWLK